MRKVISTMDLAQKAITAAVIALVLTCTLAVITLGYELASGRLDHIYDPDYCGRVTITEIPERLKSIPAIPGITLYPGQISTYTYKLSFGYTELDAWLGQPQPRSDTPMDVVIDMATQQTVHFNVFTKRPELLTLATGNFYVSINRSVVCEMRDLLKGTDGPYTFEVDLCPLSFNSAELVLRSGLRFVRQNFGSSTDQTVATICIGLVVIAIVAFYKWKLKVYNPIRFRLSLGYDDSNPFGRWAS